MSNNFSTIAREGSGARLNATQYREWHAKVKRHDLLEAAVKLHLEFLASLPSGWLAHTSGDVGKLNDAYIASRKAGVEIPHKSNAEVSEVAVADSTITSGVRPPLSLD